MSIEKEKLEKRTPIYEGKLLHIYYDDVTIGGRKAWREVVLHPGAAAIIPVEAHGEPPTRRSSRPSLANWGRVRICAKTNTSPICEGHMPGKPVWRRAS